MTCAVVHLIMVSQLVSVYKYLVVTVTHSLSLSLFVDCLVLSLPPSLPLCFYCFLRSLPLFTFVIIISIVY